MTNRNKSKPISTRSGALNTPLPRNKSQAQAQSFCFLKDAATGVRIVNITTDPQEFFSVYDCLLDIFERLAYCERWISFDGERPSTALSRFLATRSDETEKFINRFAQETRVRIYNISSLSVKRNQAAAFYKTLMEYEEYFQGNEKLSKHIASVYEGLKSLIIAEASTEQVSDPAAELLKYNELLYI